MFVLLYFMQKHLYFVVSEVYLFARFRCCMTSETTMQARYCAFYKIILATYSYIIALPFENDLRGIMSFFRQMSVVVHKHMTLGFINGYCVQPRVRMHDKYKYSCAVLLTRLSICFTQVLLNETTV